MPERVVLRGGPFDGREVEVERGRTLIVEGEPLADGMVARYRPARERGVYRFREYDRIVLRVPASTEGGEDDRG